MKISPVGRLFVLGVWLGWTFGSLQATAAESTGLSAEGASAGWQPLFDGKSFAGWRGYRMTAMPPRGWKVEGGMLEKVGGEKGGDIVTVRRFDDFEFSWEWKVAAGGNNGVKYLVTEQRPGAPGHEYQMIDDAKNADALASPKRVTASFYEVLPPQAGTAARPAGEWNESLIRLQGQHVEHWLNGKKVLEYELGSERVQQAIARSKFKNAKGFGDKITGHILLTDHGDSCWFRNLRVRELKSAAK